MSKPVLSSAYGWMMITSIVISISLWVRLGRRDSRLLPLYIAALFGALFGAKIAFLLSEGWMHLNDENRWVILAGGKSITGALLGGYVAVEIAKKLTHYLKPTGDLFALVVPVGIGLGRVGCILHGCCLGVQCSENWFTVTDSLGTPRWPAAQAELAFNVMAGLVLWTFKRRQILPGQLFHVYLMAYGLFRFTHEFWRETPRFLLGLSGYHGWALALFGFGLWRFLVRQHAMERELSRPLPSEAPHPDRLDQTSARSPFLPICAPDRDSKRG